jgi:hemerythrin-like domain-containing protein
MKITEALFAEHLVFHNLFDHIERTAPGLKTIAEVRTLAQVMETMLSSHSKTEDDLFIGPLEHCFEQIGQRESFHLEHKEIDESLKRVQEATRVKLAQDLLLRAVAYSRRHFEREERIVFPMAERVLNAKTLEDLGRAWTLQREEPAVKAPQG